MTQTFRMTVEEYEDFLRKRGGKPKTRSKMGNEKVVDEEGIKHDSKREAMHWRVLCARLRAGEIQALGRQTRFILAGLVIYVADFTYVEKGQYRIVDAKGFRTDVYKIKKKLMQDIGFSVEEV